MELTPGMKALAEKANPVYEKAESVIHQWGHITRTARGAAWFVHVLGGTEREEQLAYVAGILHDIVRPITEEVCHAQASVEKALTIIEGCPEFTDTERENICEAIRDHRNPTEWKSLLHQSVYLSDKILEHMGAYFDFRGCVWAGELSHTDFEGLEPVEAILGYYEKASRKLLTGTFVDSVKGLADYQRGWNRAFLEALRRGEDWVVDMGERLFIAGRGKADFEETLIRFGPRGRNQEKWKVEMRVYVEGKRFDQFEDLISDK